MLDTGADRTMIPSYAPGYLRLPEMGREYNTQGILGPASFEPVYSAFIFVEDYPAHEVRANSFGFPYAILGRDVLNHYQITLDGPNLTLTITR